MPSSRNDLRPIRGKQWWRRQRVYLGILQLLHPMGSPCMAVTLRVDFKPQNNCTNE